MLSVGGAQFPRVEMHSSGIILAMLHYFCAEGSEKQGAQLTLCVGSFSCLDNRRSLFFSVY